MPRWRTSGELGMKSRMISRHVTARNLVPARGARGHRHPRRGRNEPAFDVPDLVGGQTTLDHPLEPVDVRTGGVEPPLALGGQVHLQDAPVGGMGGALHQTVPLERDEHAVHRLGTDVAPAREVGAGHARVAREHRQCRVLGRGEPVGAKGDIHRGAELVPGLAQEVATAPLRTAVALPDRWHAHGAGEYQGLDNTSCSCQYRKNLISGPTMPRDQTPTARMSGPPPLDWSLGRYERTAKQLLPAARLVVERAAPRAGERVVDVGCGTGNAALLAAERGARVTGVDPAARLLDVAREEAAARGLDADFALGEAAALPLADGEADVVLSVFGLIFAPGPQAAAAELDRVTAPGGRIVLSAWLPGGGMSDAIRVSREAVARVMKLPPGPQPFAWHERGDLARLFAPNGFEVSLEEATIAFTATSARAHLEAESEDHPMAVAGRAVLEQHGENEAVFE